MTIFYKVDPSDVRKQRGDFGYTFKKTCEGKTEEVKQRWIKALNDAATIAGENSLNWANEAEMIQKIATDVSNKLNVTPSRDFEGMVGLEAHLTKLDSFLCLESDDVKMIGIWGPAGIGKTTLARALFNQLSTRFRRSCFMGTIDVNDYDSKLCLQNKLLSKILNQKDMRVHHLGAIKEWLHDQRVLIVLDDVDDLEQLEVLAKETSWFGPGSRIIVTLKDKKILKAHGINDIYHVDYPSEKEAFEIFCLSAFKQSSPQDGFEELARKVVELCGNLPLALRVVGSSFYGESEDEWRIQLYGIETNLDRKIENVLRVGYDKLSERHQSLFLHIACFFNHKSVDYVTTMLADSVLDVENGLNTLAAKSLVSTNGWITMHCLLQQLGRQVVLQQGDPGKRQFLVEAKEIRDVLANETGTESVIGISFDISKIEALSISKRAFNRMRNLKFLNFYNGNISLLEDMEYLPRLRLLHWGSYPRKSLPLAFKPECLVELYMGSSKLEKLWGGIQPLTNLKKINLGYSSNLKEIPNLSKATNLKTLTLTGCESLVEIPSSILNLQKLEMLYASGCSKLQVIPTNINLASLEEVNMSNCSRLRSFPDMSSNIKRLYVAGTMIKEFPASIVGQWCRLDFLQIGSRSFKRLTHVPESVTHLDLRNSDIKMIPDCIIGLSHLVSLLVENCTKLVSIQGHSPSLVTLFADHCISLQSVCCSFHGPISKSMFYNCLKLDKESKRGIIQQSGNKSICLPGKEIPAEFTHQTSGNLITISLAPGCEEAFSAFSRFKACLLLSPIKDFAFNKINCILRSREGVKINCTTESIYPFVSGGSLSEHLFIFCGDLFPEENRGLMDVTPNEILFDFSSSDVEIMECGVKIFLSSGIEVGYSETGGNRNHHIDGEAEAFKVAQVENSKHTGHWSWLRKLRLGKNNKTELSSRAVSGSSDDTRGISMRYLEHEAVELTKDESITDLFRLLCIGSLAVCVFFSVYFGQPLVVSVLLLFYCLFLQLQ
ncbi:disease resistance protein RML1A isoform X1 [Arabidopsis lyrata subsp. lyrata]|nr:disease resistance protein RML1A isoform X1 [Arabidopsis lyrata subsp. lyrata]XP_020872730.1 disease resistance protein RML1A isoform X1 [Arabidopsis lyrata subsp. lyrata]|eukprot:XP_002870667.2 disease resistance protein RML1A isoform X1 [Arabidopsis lyrata subsp. lyrata]